MKILLINEASGVLVTFKREFVKMGHDVDIVSLNNKQKRSGIQTFSFGNNFMGQVLGQIRMFFYLFFNLNKYDMIIVTSTPYFISTLSFLPNIIIDVMFKRIKSTTKLFYYALGCDSLYSNSNSLYCKECVSFPDGQSKKCKLLNQPYLNKYKYTLEKYYNNIFVAMEDYNNYQGYNVKTTWLPLPFIKATSFNKNKKNNFTIFHAPSSKNRKGSKYILKAFEVLSKKYTEHKFKIIENVSYEEFKEVFDDSDIVVDQCLSKSYGMLGLETLYNNKVLLSGNSLLHLGIDEVNFINPIVEITPENVLSKLDEVISNYKQFERSSQMNSTVICEKHRVSVIVKKVLDVYEND